jgi:conjugative relaxase-like TrwC/TraI family protein
MAMMGERSVDYHRATVIERADDFAAQSLDYYGSRGETPLVWGGSGANDLGLGVGRAVTLVEYEALFAPGGATDPASGVRLVGTRRPGMEIIVSAHKSVAELGVMHLGEVMHGLLDAERDATLAYLDEVTRARGGRRGRARTAVATGGLVYAHTRHTTSRAGDPCPHDHVLVANLVQMQDGAGGWKAADTALWRDELHAATMVGRLASARRAVELGWGIEADPGPSGSLRHWRLRGIPDEVLELHSKRSAEIDAHVESRGGWNSQRARGLAARETRKAKRFEPEGRLMARWRRELQEAGWSPSVLRERLDAHRLGETPGPLNDHELAELVDWAMRPDGELARGKVFNRAEVIVAVAPRLFGRPTDDLGRVIEAVLAHPEVLPMLGVAGARVRHYTLASVVAAEQAIAAAVADGATRRSQSPLPQAAVARAVGKAQQRLGHRLSRGQLEAVVGICMAGRAVSVVVGVAGSGKTTALAAVADAYGSCGYRVLGTATSGQAARTLGREAAVADSRTVSSLRWGLDHGRLALDGRSLLILDEAGMTDDRDLLAVLTQARAAGAKVVLVGDDRQLGPVGPGGALGALLRRLGGSAHVLDENLRQADPAERAALEQLRSGEVARAVAWYVAHDRIRPCLDRDEAIAAAVEGWIADTLGGRESVMLAWRKESVRALNQEARQRWAEAGRLAGPELVAAGGRRYAAGDRVVTLAPSGHGRLLTSQRGQVTAVDSKAETAMTHMDDGSLHQLSRDDLSADRICYAYALTIHRSQGLTTDTCHHLADGGGRELAYVAASRARQHTTIHAVADDLDQALEDLTRDWSQDRRPRWAIDTGTPTTRAQLAVNEQTTKQLQSSIDNARQRQRRAIATGPPGQAAAAPGFQSEIDSHATRAERGLGF